MHRIIRLSLVFLLFINNIPELCSEKNALSTPGLCELNANYNKLFNNIIALNTGNLGADSIENEYNLELSAKTNLVNEIADKLRNLSGIDFNINVHRRNSVNNPPSAAWVKTDPKTQKITIHLLEEFLDILQEDEIAFVLAHEIGHPDNKDFHLANELKKYSNQKRFKNALSFIDAHTQIEADKKGIEYISRLGYDKNAALRVIDKFIGLTGITYALKIRRSVLKDRIDNPDNLNDIYGSFLSEFYTNTFGFRYKMENGMEDVHARAYDILLLAEKIIDVITHLGNLDDTIEWLRIKISKLEGLPSYSPKIRKRGDIFDAAISIGLIEEELRNIEKAKEYIHDYTYYRDSFMVLLEKFQWTFDEMMRNPDAAVRARTASSKIKAAKGYHRLKDTFHEMPQREFGYEIFSKYIALPMKFRILFWDFDSYKKPVKPIDPKPPTGPDKPTRREFLKELIAAIIVFAIPIPIFEKKSHLATKIDYVDHTSVTDVPPIWPTFYVPGDSKVGHTMVTKSGLWFEPVGEGKHAVKVESNGDYKNFVFQDFGIVAVDPAVIRLRSIIRVTLKDGRTFRFIAADTGGKVKGNVIDFSINEFNWDINRAVLNELEDAKIETEKEDEYYIASKKDAAHRLVEEKKSIPIVKNYIEAKKEWNWKTGFGIIPFLLYKTIKKTPDDKSNNNTNNKSADTNRKDNALLRYSKNPMEAIKNTATHMHFINGSQ